MVRNKKANFCQFSAKKDGKGLIVARWIKTHYNVCLTALAMVHSIWIHKLAIANQNGAVTIVQKVRISPRSQHVHIIYKTCRMHSVPSLVYKCF